MLRLQPSRIEMLPGEGIIVPPRKHSLQRINVYESSNNAWQSSRASTHHGNKFRSRPSVKRGPQRSREDSIVMYQSEDMHRSYSTESVSSSEDDEIGHVGHSNMDFNTTPHAKITYSDPDQTSSQWFSDLTYIKSSPQGSAKYRRNCSSSLHKRRDSVLSEIGSSSDSEGSLLPVLTSSPCVKLNLSLGNQEHPACNDRIRQYTPDPDNNNNNTDGSALKVVVNKHQNRQSHLCKQHNRSFSEPRITSLTRHRPHATPRHRRYVSLDVKGHSRILGTEFSHRPYAAFPSPASNIKSILTTHLTESSPSMESSLEHQTLDGQSSPSAGKNKKTPVNPPATTRDDGREEELIARRALQQPQAFQLEILPSSRSDQPISEHSIPRHRSPISSASAEATKNRQSPLDEIVREASLHLANPWIASLPIRDRGTEGLLPGFRFPSFDEPPTPPPVPTPSSNIGQGFLTPVHQRRERRPENAGVSMPLYMSSSPPIRRPVPSEVFYDPGGSRYPQTQPLPQQQLQPSRFRASTWTSARTSHTSTPTPSASGTAGPQVIARTHARSMHQIRRRPLPAHQPARQLGPSADQENEDWQHRYEQEIANHQARHQQSARGGIMEETPPREGRLERRLH